MCLFSCLFYFKWNNVICVYFEAICTEAGMLALRAQRKLVCMEDFEKAMERVLLNKKSDAPEEFFLWRTWGVRPLIHLRSSTSNTPEELLQYVNRLEFEHYWCNYIWKNTRNYRSNDDFVILCNHLIIWHYYMY